MSSRRYFSRSPVPGERSRSSRPPGYHALSPNRSSHGRNYYSRSRTIVNGSMPSHHLSSSGSRGWSRPIEPSIQATATAGSERKEVSSLLSLNELPARERLLVPEVLDAEETTVVEKTIDAFKSRGHFDDFRKEFLDAMEKMPRYKSLRYMVMSTVSKYTARQGPFHPGMRKPVMRDGLREELMRESNGLSTWINDLVDDLIGPNIERRIRSVVQETLEDFIPDEKAEVTSYLDQENQPFDPNVMAPVTNGVQVGAQRPERLPTPPPLVKHYSEQLAMAKIESERQEQINNRLTDVSVMRYDSNASQQVGVPVDMEEDTVDSGGTGQSPIAPVPIDDEVANVTQSATVNEEAKTAGVMPQLLFNQLAHFSMYPQDAPPELREALLSSSVAPTSQSSSSSQQSQSSGGATVEMSVMVDEPPTGVEDIISPEMMDIEDGDSPDPNSHHPGHTTDAHDRRRNTIAASETWSADESATTTATTADSLDQDYRFMILSAEMPVLTPATAPFSMDSPAPSDVSNNAVTSNPASPIKSRSTLGSLLLEKRKLKMKSVVSKPTPIRKGSNSDIESISSESDFGSSSSSSSESNSSGDEESVSKNNREPKNSGRSKPNEAPELASKIEASDRGSQRVSSSFEKESSRKEGSDDHRQTHRDREPESDQHHDHVSRYGRRGRQPRRYSPDVERRRGSPGFSESPSASSRTTPRKSQKSTPKRFYPGNSPSMLLKRKRSPSPQVKEEMVSTKRERTPEERKPFKREKSEQRYEERSLKQEPVENPLRHREQRSPSSSKVVEKRTRKEMPKVHLSSRSARNDQEPSDHMYRASDQQPPISSRDRKDKNYLTNEKDRRSASRDASSQSEIEEPKSEVKRLEARESKFDQKRSEDLYSNSEKDFKEKKSKECVNDKVEVKTPPIEVEDASVNASTEEYQQSSNKETTTDESKMDISIDTDSSPKKEKEKAKKEAEDLEEGEISDDSDSSYKPPSEIGSPTFSKSATKESSPPLKATKLHNDLSKLKAEFPPAPPPLPPLKKKRKKGKRSSESSSSESDDSDDSLIERLTKKDTKSRPTTRPPPIQNYPSNEMMMINNDYSRPPPTFGGGGEGGGYMYSAIVDDRDERKRGSFGPPQMMSKVVSEKEMTAMMSRQSQRGGRNKDSWNGASMSLRDRYKVGMSCSFTSCCRSVLTTNNPFYSVAIRPYPRHSRSRQSSTDPDSYNTRNCIRSERVPRQYKEDEQRALSPEFHEKGKWSPPPMIYEKAMPKIRLSANEKDAMRRSKPKHQELPPPPPLTRKVPYPPPPMASLDDDPSSGSDSNQSSSSDESTSSSSSGQSTRKSKKKAKKQSKRSTPGSTERHQRKLHHNSGSKHEVNTSYRSSSKRSHEMSSSKSSSGRHYDVQKWASASNYSSRYEDTSKHTDEDQRCSSQASSDEVLVSNSHTPPRGR